MLTGHADVRVVLAERPLITSRSLNVVPRGARPKLVGNNCSAFLQIEIPCRAYELAPPPVRRPRETPSCNANSPQTEGTL